MNIQKQTGRMKKEVLEASRLFSSYVVLGSFKPVSPSAEGGAGRLGSVSTSHLYEPIVMLPCLKTGAHPQAASSPNIRTKLKYCFLAFLLNCAPVSCFTVATRTL